MCKLEYYVHARHQGRQGKITIGLIPENSSNESENKMRIGAIEAAKLYNVNLICFTHLDAITKNTAFYGHDAEQYQHSHDILQQLIAQFELDGLLFLGWSMLFDKEGIHKLQQQFPHIPLLSLGKEFPDIPSSYFDGEAYIKELLHHLIHDHGYKKIAFIEWWSEDTRKNAYLEVMNEHQLFNNNLLVSSKDLEGVMLSDRPRRTLEILYDERGVELEAIVIMLAEEARIMVEQLKLRGKHIPEDIAITCYEDNISVQYAYSPMTTIYYPFQEIGYTGCEKMIDLLTTGKIALVNYVPGHIQIRNSCGCNRGEVHSYLTDQDEQLLQQQLEFQRLDDSFKRTLESGFNSKEFLVLLHHQLRESAASFNDYQTLISLLRKKYASTSSDIRKSLQIEDLWHSARVMIGECEKSWIANDMLARKRLDKTLEVFSQSLLNTFSIPKILNVLEFNLKLLRIRSCNIFLSGKEESRFEQCTHIYGYSDSQGTLIRAAKIRTKDYYHEFIQTNAESRILVVSLLHVETNNIGFICFEPGPLDGSLYLRLAIQLSNALSGTLMVDKLTHEIKLRTKKENQLSYYANYDTATDLLNRNSFYEALTLLDPAVEFYVFYLDLDGFKVVNDSLGHDIGDLVLVEVSNRIKLLLSEHVIPYPKHWRLVGRQGVQSIFRIGGDEFTAMIRHSDHMEEIAELATLLVEKIRMPYYINGNRILISSSIGISSYPKDTLDRNLLIRYADIAMYNVKKYGGSSYQFFNMQLEQEANTKLELGNELRLALENEELFLQYQPQVDCRDGAIVGVEALLRWQHPTKGLVSPGEFISLAEDMGLIVPIGEWVLRKACERMRLWHDANLPLIRISVNLSAKQFMDGKLVEKVVRILEETGLAPKYLELEITENIAMKDEQFIVLRELRTMGITISIDDFGTQYSSLSYLKRFPVDKLKLDKSFIRGIQTDAKDREMIKAIISVAKSFELDIIAEGVETSMEKDFLKENGCYLIQGFHFYKPMNSDEIISALRSGR